jgi:2,5-diamino-6-(ribosylamino)-4(3H)-pyrimidinone 5'-phosphate reductase
VCEWIFPPYDRGVIRERPRVVIHNAVSADGRIDGFAANLAAYYELARGFGEDATLVGSGTVLAAPLADEPDGAPGGDEPEPSPRSDLPLLVVADGRGRVTSWRALRRAGYWRDVLALCCRATPPDFLARLTADGIEHALVGEERVDLAQALSLLVREHGVGVVRVDSGGTLNGALLREGLVDEISLLVHPALAGGRSPGSFHGLLPDGENPRIALHPPRVQALEGGLLWLRWQVDRQSL